MKIVGIHGVGKAYLGAEQLKLQWLAALRDGLSEADGGRIEDHDFDMAFYGSVFRPAGARASGAPILHPGDLDDWEQQMLVTWWQEAAALSAGSAGGEGDEATDIQPPNFQGRARTPQAAQGALRQLAKSRFFKAFGSERMLLFGLRQVRLFLYDAHIKGLILERVAQRITSDTKVVVAHSLGSLAAYEALCANPQWRIDTLLTVGSPLGISNLIFEALTPAPRDGRGAWPYVRRWVNIADQGDIVALQKDLAPRFGPVEDRLVDNGWRAHEASRYLCSREAGEAVAGALKAAASVP
jgi:hypothetical protein